MSHSQACHSQRQWLSWGDNEGPVGHLAINSQSFIKPYFFIVQMRSSVLTYELVAASRQARLSYMSDSTVKLTAPG